MNPPFNYEEINTINAAYTPSTVHVRNSSIYRYFKKYLLEEAMSLYEIKIPTNWSKTFFNYVLFCSGFIGVINTDKFGVICQNGGLYGRDVFYQPTHMIITNPLINQSLMPRIGVDCEIIKLQPNYSGIIDIVDFYAANMALCAETIQVNLFNSHLSYVFGVENKSAAESMKKMYDQIGRGEPAVFIDKNLYRDDGSASWQYICQDVKNNLIAPEIATMLRRWKEMFDTEIGIPNANTDKRERLNSLEITSNNLETQCKSLMWLETMQDGASRVNDMFGIDISIELRPEVKSAYREGSANNARDTINNGLV